LCHLAQKLCHSAQKISHPTGEFLASNLNADRDDQRVVDALIAAQNAAFELCGNTDFEGAWHKLAVYCGQNLPLVPHR